jgi:hypothetical protein
VIAPFCARYSSRSTSSATIAGDNPEIPEMETTMATKKEIVDRGLVEAAGGERELYIARLEDAIERLLAKVREMATCCKARDAMAMGCPCAAGALEQNEER